MRSDADAVVNGLLDEAEEQGRCAFSRNRGEARMLERRFAAGVIVKPCKQMFARRERWDALSPVERHLCILRTCAALHPAWVFGGPSAAAVHGLFVSNDALDVVHVRSPYQLRSQVAVHRIDRSGEFEIVQGMRVAPLGETMFDCLRRLDFAKGLAIADSGIAKLGLPRDEALVRFAQKWRRRKGVRRALSVLACANPLSENGGESIARAVMIEEGFQVPALQVELPNPLGGGVYRVDFLWTLPDGRRIAGELDGMRKYRDSRYMEGRSTADVLIAERERESRLNALGLLVMRFKYADVLDRRRFIRLLDRFGIPRASAPTPPNHSWSKGAR